MCTVSWFFTDEGYELFGNRDESRQRLAALPPRLWQGASGSFLAPEDTTAGGSWVTINEHGVSLCLLNLYEAPAPPPPASGWTSRGLLVTSLANVQDLTRLEGELASLEVSTFRPFTLVALAPGRRVSLFRWDGASLKHESGPEPPLSSSGFDAAGAAAARRRLFAELVSSPADSSSYLAFHRSHRPERGPFSPCMHRHDAVTVSLTWVRVESHQSTMAYTAGSPCESPWSQPLVLRRQPWVASPDSVS